MQNRFRIIGGEWRSRRFAFPDNPALRPSPDRVRETLFNWLAPVIVGARCVDLYAGSGALGLEALSRGAAHVTFVDRDRAVIDAIDAHLKTLQCERAHTRISEVGAFLAHAPDAPVDVVFLDPPFGMGLAARTLAALAAQGWLRPGGYAYVETEAGLEVELPAGWRWHRQAHAGRVAYGLVMAPLSAID